VLSNQYNSNNDVSWLRSKQTITKPLPLKIFILVGQSNMQGHGYIDEKDKTTNQYLNGTLEWMIETYPEKYGRLKRKKRHAKKHSADEHISNDKNQLSSSYVSRDDVWIIYNKQNYDSVKVEMNEYGPLVPGYGGDPGQFHMGPELSFGWTAGDEFQKQKQQILLLKVAWGGRSLAVEFRPPSSGGTTGLFYEAMMADTFKVLANLDQYFPAYANIGSYEIAGFAWHQGWNDGCDDNMAKEYESNLANLIRDVRRDLGVPNLPGESSKSFVRVYCTCKSG
jgi:alpha-galactosidase